MRIGFRGVHVKRVKSNLIIRGEAARSFLQSWDVKRTFWKTRNVELVSEGLEVPDWVIISGRKP
jgi:hypothetical protein